MAFFAPMIGKVTRTIFNQADANIIELLRTPVSYSCFPLVFSGGYLRPKGCTKGDISQVHFGRFVGKGSITDISSFRKTRTFYENL
jgi:hypothetical protein